MFKGNGLPLSKMDEVEIHGFAGGHSYMGGFYKEDPITQSNDGDPVASQYRKSMVDAYGEKRADDIMSWDTFNHLIYPNLILNPKHQQMRLLQPESVDRTICAFDVFPLKRRTRRNVSAERSFSYRTQLSGVINHDRRYRHV